MISHIFDPAHYAVSASAMPTLATTAILLLLGLLVLIRERASPVSLLFAVVTLTVSVWLFAFSWMYCATTEAVALWWAKAAYLGVPLIAAAIYHFTVVALQIERRHRGLVWAAWLVSVSFAGIALESEALIAGLYRYGWGAYPKYGWLSLPFLTFFFGMMIASLRHYWTEYHAARPGTRKRRIKTFMIAFAFAYVATADFAPKFGIPLYPFGYLPVAGWLTLVAIAIWRHQFVDITPALAADQITSIMADALLVFDREGLVRVANQAACELFELPHAELVGKPLATIRNGFIPRETMDTLLRTGAIRSYEVSFPGRQGRLLSLELSASVVRDRASQPMAFVCIARDTTERKQAEAALKASEERFRSVAQSANDAIISADSRGHIVSWNRGAQTIFGHAEAEILDRPLSLLLSARYRDLFEGGLGDAHVIGKTVEWHGLRRDGREFPLELSLATWETGGKVFYSIIIRDITERKQAEKDLENKALYDPLTSLPNRALFSDHLRRAVGRAKRDHDYQFALLFLDLDRFKIVNDSLGHLEGDQLLSEFARRIESCLRPGDTVARLGGDEFAILLNEINGLSDATRVAERIHKVLGRPFLLRGHEVFTTVSIGIALSMTGYDSPEDVLRDADTAMYRAKALGKARHVVFDTVMHARAVSLLVFEADLRRAVDRQELLIYYQPIVSLATGRIVGFEALARWRHPERGLVFPDEFITVAEETGLIVPIGLWMLREACREVRAWQMQFPATPPLSVSVNLSGKQFVQPDLVEQIDAILREVGLDAPCLRLEITESVIMDHADSTNAMLVQLRELGLHLYLDDFGTGYSSLRYLHRFPIDALKIDRSFISRMHAQGKNLEIVRTIVALAQNLGIHTIAEGIELAEHMAQLRALKCEYGQGYYFSEPVERSAVGAFMASDRRW